MKGLKKILALVLCGIIVFACTACSDGGGLGSGTKVDNSKRTVVKLYVSGGGYGSKPYEEQAARFREATSEKIYEPGTDKKGAAVEVVVADSAESIKLDAGLLNQGYHIVGGSSYEKSIDAVVGDQLATNIDAIMRTTIPGENKTIIDKIPESQRWMYSVKSSTTTNEDGRVYYGFPGVQAYGGLTYDKDLFDEKLCYIAKPDATEGIQTYNCTIIRQQVKFTNVEASKSVGPDGIANTEDDGMPSSLYELIALCDKLKVRDKIAPFMLLGDTRFTFYNNYFADALYASLLGAENALAINNFKSDEMEVVVGFTNEPLFPGDTASGLKKPIPQDSGAGSPPAQLRSVSTVSPASPSEREVGLSESWTRMADAF